MYSKRCTTWGLWAALALVTTLFYVGAAYYSHHLALSADDSSTVGVARAVPARLAQRVSLTHGAAKHRKSVTPTEEREVHQELNVREDESEHENKDMLPAPSHERMETAEAGSDTSIRCRVSDICDAGGNGAPCSSGRDGLGCIEGAAERRERVRSAIKWAWQGYTQCAWGWDDLKPVSCSHSVWLGMGVTIVDSLDTLILAGLREEAEHALGWIQTGLDVEHAAADSGVSTFETVIRVLGGLLSAFHLLQGDRSVLSPAIDLGLRLLSAFNTSSGLPYNIVDLETMQGRDARWTTDISLSEATTLSLEFCYLSQVTNCPEIAEPALRAFSLVHDAPGTVDGLGSIFLSRKGRNGVKFAQSTVSFGARGDSYYEYMLKQFLLRGAQDVAFRDAYVESMQGMRTHLLGRTRTEGATARLESGWGLKGEPGLLYVGEQKLAKMRMPDMTALALTAHEEDVAAELHHADPKMDHLVCFLPGLLALGHLHGVESGRAHRREEMSDMHLAEALMHTCYSMYLHVPLGIAPEIVYFVPDDSAASRDKKQGEVGGGHFTVKHPDAYSLLRPETVESLFVMWQATHNETYRDWGWSIFRAIEMHARVDLGYASIESVLADHAEHKDHMQSFFLAETLKYLLLLFSEDEVMPLKEYVLNTEAHPFPILGSRLEQSQRKWYLDKPRDVLLNGDLSPTSLQHAIDFYRAQ